MFINALESQGYKRRRFFFFEDFFFFLFFFFSSFQCFLCFYCGFVCIGGVGCVTWVVHVTRGNIHVLLNVSTLNGATRIHNILQITAWNVCNAKYLSIGISFVCIVYSLILYIPSFAVIMSSSSITRCIRNWNLQTTVIILM